METRIDEIATGITRLSTYARRVEAAMREARA